MILTGDVMDILPTLEACSFDACLCDPPYGLEFMGQAWDAPWRQSDVTPANRGTLTNMVNPNGKPKFKTKAPAFNLSSGASAGFQSWCEAWAREVLRVLKPGAFLLAFGGTRTHHRLMCAIEDAGFEVRDCMMWLYGSGFPKSLNVALSIDKASRGVPQGGSDPTSPNHGKFKGGCSEDNPGGRGFGAGPGQFMTEAGEKQARELVTEAQRWNGYGTALKPAFEPVLLCSKPLTVEQYLAMMVQEITNQLCRIFNAFDAESLFTDTRAKLLKALASTVHENVRTCSPENTESVWFAPPSSTFRSAEQSGQTVDARGSSAPSSARPNGNAGDTLENRTLAGAADAILIRLTDMCMSVMAPAMSESIAKLWKDTSDDLLTVASKFTIETASRLIIGLRTFRSFLAQTTSKGIGNLCPEFLPIIVAMKPCEGTFTENALKWGVAGLAIDAGRIQSGPSAGGSISGASAFGQGFGWNEHANRTTQIDRNAPDRWPANVILDEEAGEMLDRQSGDRSSPWIGNPNTTGHKGGKMFGGSEQGEQADQKPEYRDSGGASRFFYCAKASRSERGEGNTHPCVKPIKLCEYLAKLLLPPKRDDARRLLVPFSGSGSEMIGALRAGWDEVVGIESNPEYVAIAERRIAGEAPLFADDGELR